MRTRTFRYKGSYLSFVMIYFWAYFAMASFSAVLSVYLTNTGKTATEMSFIISAAGLFSFPIVPLAGYLCDRMDRHRQISAVLLCAMGALALLFAYCRQVWVLFVLDGLVLSFYNATAPVSERLAAACRYRYGTLRIWGTFGFAAGAQAAGIAVQSFPPIALFSLVAAAALLAALGYLSAGDPDPQQSGPEEPSSGEAAPKAKLSSFLRDPKFLLLLFLAFLSAGASGVNGNYLPLLLDRLGVSTGVVGTVLFFSTIVEVPLILFSNKFMDRFSSGDLFLLDFCLFFLQYFLYGLSHSAGVVIAVAISIKAIASTLMMMIFLKTVNNIVSPELATTGLSVVNAAINLGNISLQNLGGVIVDHSSIHTLYFCMAGLAVAGALLSRLLKVDNSREVFS